MRMPHITLTVIMILAVGYIVGHYFPQLGNRFLP